MMLHVIYTDGSHDRIESHNLSHLIREGRIAAFKRASGWAFVGKDRIRRFDYDGQERISGTLTSEGEAQCELQPRQLARE